MPATCNSNVYLVKGACTSKVFTQVPYKVHALAQVLTKATASTKVPSIPSASTKLPYACKVYDVYVFIFCVKDLPKVDELLFSVIIGYSQTEYLFDIHGTSN